MREVERIGVTEILGREIVFYDTWEEPLFLGRDIADWIGHNTPGEIVSGLDSDKKEKCKVRHAGQVREMWLLTKLGVKVALSNSRKPEARTILNKLKETWKYTYTPKEVEFASMLKDMLRVHEETFERFHGDCDYIPCGDDLYYLEYFNFKMQYKVLNYYVDFYFPELMLVVEYDEKHHKQQKAKDNRRMAEIVDELGKRHKLYGAEFTGEDLVKVIRVKEGEEVAGLIQILTCITGLFVL